jgi:hypothetical protein
VPFTALNGYPSTVNGEGAPSSLKLQDAAPAANSMTTANFATTTTRRKIAWRPGVGGNTTAATPGAATGLGYNILKAEMNRTVDLPSEALIQAGVWDFSVAFTTAQADAAGAAAKVEAWVYRRSAAGTFTSLFSVTMATGVAVTLAGAKTAVFSSTSQPAFTFETDETLHVELWIDAQGVAVVGNIYSLDLGANTWVNFPQIASQTQGILDHHPRSHSATAIGVATRQSNFVRFAAKVATAVGVAPVPLKWIRQIPKTATAIGVTPVPSKYARLAAKTATAIGVATRQPNYVRLAAKTATAVGVATRQPNWIRLAAKSAAAVGVASYTRRIEAVRSFAATAIGIPSYTRAVIAVRTFAATALGVARGDIEIPMVALNRITSGGPTDWSPNNGAKTIAGVVRDSTGVAYAGATVQLVRESDGFVAATTTSAADGTYSFGRDINDPYTYRVLAFEDTGTPTQGVSARGLVPV